MPDNLTIQIGADTAKARGEFRLLTAELKNLDRQINAAVKAGDVARAKELTTTFGVMKDRAVAVDRGLKQLGASGSRALNEVRRSADGATSSLAGTSRGARRLLSELSSLRGLGTLLGGGLAGGAIGAGVGIALEKVISQFEDLAKSMRQIRDLARDTGAKPLMVQGMQELAKETGESAETANKFLTGLGATLASVATKTRDVNTGIAVGGKAAEDAGRNFAVFGDKVVSVGRGGVPVIRDFGDALAILQVNEQQLLRLPVDQQMKLVSQAFLRAEQNAKQLGLTEIQLNEISKNLFGVPAVAADKLARGYLNIQGKVDELANSQRGATKENSDNVDQVAKAQEKLGQQISETTSRAANASSGMRASIISAFANVIKFADDNFTSKGPLAQRTQELADTIRNFYDRMAEDSKKVEPVPPDTSEKIQKEFSDLPGFFGGLTTTIGKIWSGFWGSLIGSAQAATNQVKESAAQASAAITLPTVNVSASGPGMPQVFRGSGPGDTGGYGPSSLGGAGYGPGSRPTQSILPGVSDYQAPPPQMVSPIAVSAGMGWAASAAKSSADAAEASKNAAEASAKAVNAWVDQPSTGYAGGGMVHGPGTATSDSIVARLSAGEFVMRAAAVNRLGAGFMSAINGFADGGLVMPSRGIPSFANGGMVTAGAGGTPVHLHLGGHSFALSGNEGVVSALVTEAHRHKIRSAGTKPSWYGGTPGR